MPISPTYVAAGLPLCKPFVAFAYSTASWSSHVSIRIAQLV